MSNYMNDVLIVGTGYMGTEYCKVLCAQGITPFVVGRSAEGCSSFTEKTGVDASIGGIASHIEKTGSVPKTAIVAVGIDSLAETANLLLDNGVKRMLLEKPGGMSRREIEEIARNALDRDASVYLAYNRRFYAATRTAMKMIEEDGGVSSFNFEFTEWSDNIVKLKHPDKVKDIWLLANSSHVIDLAFFLGGYPKEMSSYVSGSLPWHKNGSVYSGAGISESGALFSYQANWGAPGRWGVEILTLKRRLIFRPMEKLQVQNQNSVKIDLVELDDKLDVDYKPGLYSQVEAFLKGFADSGLLDVQTYMEHFEIYEKISGIH